MYYVIFMLCMYFLNCVLSLLYGRAHVRAYGLSARKVRCQAPPRAGGLRARLPEQQDISTEQQDIGTPAPPTLIYGI